MRSRRPTADMCPTRTSVGSAWPRRLWRASWRRRNSSPRAASSETGPGCNTRTSMCGGYSSKLRRVQEGGRLHRPLPRQRHGRLWGRRLAQRSSSARQLTTSACLRANHPSALQDTTAWCTWYTDAPTYGPRVGPTTYGFSRTCGGNSLRQFSAAACENYSWYGIWLPLPSGTV